MLTVADLDRTVAFYSDVLGMEHVIFDGRSALHFGVSKFNLHLAGHEFEPRARRPGPGSADLCLIVDGPLTGVVDELVAHGVGIEEGPVDRTGACGPMRSVYLRDPDGNLIELSVYDD